MDISIGICINKLANVFDAHTLVLILSLEHFYCSIIGKFTSSYYVKHMFIGLFFLNEVKITFKYHVLHKYLQKRYLLECHQIIFYEI